MVMLKGQKMYPLVQAIKMLDINEHTLCAWVLADAIELVSIPDKDTGRHYLYVPEREIKKAFTTKCIICGNTFRSKHHLKAKYCSKACRNKGIYASFQRRRSALK